MPEMNERKHGVASRALLVAWSGRKLAIIRCEMMVESDMRLARLMCFGVRLDIERCMNSVVTETATFPDCRAILRIVVAANVNLVEVTMMEREHVSGNLGDKIAARHRV